MDSREEAKKELNNLCSASIMCAFDIIGRDYLNGETAFTNDLDGIYDLIDQFELAPNEIVGGIWSAISFMTTKTTTLVLMEKHYTVMVI